MRSANFEVSVNQPLGPGRILYVAGIKQASRALSNLPTLSRFSQIAIRSKRGKLVLYIGVARLIERPQIIIGFDSQDFPLLLGLQSIEGHLTLIGQTRSGKTQLAALILFQLNRLGICVIAIGCKAVDNLLIASLKAACDSPTRLDANGNRVRAKYEFCTLQPGVRTMAFNPLAQQRPPHSQFTIEAANFNRAFIAGNPAINPASRYFAGESLRLLLRCWPASSMRELAAKIERLKLNRDEKYSTAAIRNEILQFASIDQLNRPISDPLSINVATSIHSGGAIYIDCNAQDAGTLATPFASASVQSAITTKRAIAPGRSTIIIILIDEFQIFSREYGKQLIEQASSSGIILILIYHTLDQMGEDAETISMTQARIILGAVPGGSTDRHLQHLFGTREILRPSFGQVAGRSKTSNFSQSQGPIGTTITYGTGDANSQQSNITMTPDEDAVWKINDTLRLNNNREEYVCSAYPGAELTQWGGAVLGIRDEAHFSFDEINKIANDTLQNASNTYLPSQTPEKPRAGSATTALTASPTINSLGQQWQGLFARILQKLQTNSN